MDENNSTEDRPRSVAVAERLLWLSAGLGVLFALLEIMKLLPAALSGDSASSNFISAVFLAFCAVKIGDGRNWARCLLLVLFVLGSLLLLLSLIVAPEAFRSLPFPLVAIGLVQFVIQSGALILAFMPASNAWFRPATAERR